MSVSLICQIWAGLTGSALLFSSRKALRFHRLVRLLASVPLPREPRAWPRVSLLVPACNEAGTIYPAVRSLLALDYPNFEIILINDRSTDGTAEIVNQLAREDHRIRPLHIEALPPGWLGKVHALHRGEEIATGDWLLLTDADVRHHPQSLRRAIVACEQDRLEFLCVTPSFLARTLPLRVLLAQLQSNIAVTSNMDRLQDPRTGDCMGSGGYALVRRESYRRSGGLPWLKLEVLDDFGLAYALKISGARCGFLSGLGSVELEWYPHARAFARGIEKNSFTSFQYSLGAATAYVAAILFLFLGFTLAPLVGGGPVAYLCAGALALRLGIAAYYLPRCLPFSRSLTPLLPLAFVAVPLVMYRACWRVARAGGISWRGVFYPLAELRAGQRLKILDVLIKGRHFPA